MNGSRAVPKAQDWGRGLIVMRTEGTFWDVGMFYGL